MQNSYKCYLKISGHLAFSIRSENRKQREAIKKQKRNVRNRSSLFLPAGPSLSLLLIMCNKRMDRKEQFKDQTGRFFKTYILMDVMKECLKKRHSETGEGPMEPRPPVTVSLLPPHGKHRHCKSSVNGGLTSLMDWWVGGGASSSTTHKTCNRDGRWGLLPSMGE